MNQKKAKALRKKVYGDEFSPRERKYKQVYPGKIVNTGLRAIYQAGKEV
jgi:hypothetical protein